MAGVGHIAVGMAAARGRERWSSTPALRLSSLLGWAGLSMLPDSDVIGFSFGVSYDSIWGHRGVTHSFAFAVLAGVVVALVLRRRRQPGVAAGVLASVVVASHGLLDTLTDGGRGVALLWPFTDRRYFAPWHPIPVSPIGLGVISSFGLRVAAHELLLFAPVFAYAVWPRRDMRRVSAVG